MTYIQLAIDVVGGQAKLAKLVGVSQACVSEWLTRKRPIPIDRCPKIERATNGAVRCEQLFPSVAWKRKRGVVIGYEVHLGVTPSMPTASQVTASQRNARNLRVVESAKK